MADIRVEVLNQAIDEMRTKLHLRTNYVVVQEALTMLRWAMDEKQLGRLVISTDRYGHQGERLTMRSLDSVEPRAVRLNHA